MSSNDEMPGIYNELPAITNPLSREELAARDTQFNALLASLNGQEKETLLKGANGGIEDLLKAIFTLPKDKMFAALSLASSNNSGNTVDVNTPAVSGLPSRAGQNSIS